MKICIGSDHGGYQLKLEIIDHLKERGFEITDVGCDDDKSCDYPIYALKESEQPYAMTLFPLRPPENTIMPISCAWEPELWDLDLLLK